MKFEELKGVRSLIDKWSKHLTHFPYDYFKRKLISCISWDYINSFFRETVVDNLAGAVNDPVFYPWEVRMVIGSIYFVQCHNTEGGLLYERAYQRVYQTQGSQ